MIPFHCDYYCINQVDNLEVLKWTQMHRTLEHEWCLSIDLANYPRFKYHNLFLKKYIILMSGKISSSRFVHRPRYEILHFLISIQRTKFGRLEDGSTKT